MRGDRNVCKSILLGGFNGNSNDSNCGLSEWPVFVTVSMKIKPGENVSGKIFCLRRKQIYGITLLGVDYIM